MQNKSELCLFLIILFFIIYISVLQVLTKKYKTYNKIKGIFMKVAIYVDDCISNTCEIDFATCWEYNQKLNSNDKSSLYILIIIIKHQQFLILIKVLMMNFTKIKENW